MRDRSLVEELPGGLTNTNLKVTTRGPDGVATAYVVRISSSDTGLLGIDRDAEHANTRSAFEAGVGAEVFDYRPDLGALVIGFLPGAALTNETFRAPGAVERAALACRQLHAGPRFAGEFDMFARQARYLATVREHGFELPDSYADHADDWARVSAALGGRGETVPCNNDLLAGNYLDDGEVCRLIDYEYSGNNDPTFELGNTATECDFTPEMTEAFVAAYAGRRDPGMLARVRLQSLVSEYGWALWGFIQSATSPLDFDFHGWGMERYEKAARTFAGPDFETLLHEVANA